MNRLFIIILLLSGPAVAAEQAESDFLFLIDEAYTQNKRELQLTLAGGIEQQRGIERERDAEGEVEEERGLGAASFQTLNLEYGISDAFEIGLNASGMRRRMENAEEQSRSTLLGGMAGVELKTRLIKERGLRPELSISAEVRAPFGEAENDATGYETALTAARDFGNWAAHLSAGAGLTPGAAAKIEDGSRGSAHDLRELSFGAAAVYRLPGQFKAHLESKYENEEEIELDARVSRRRTALLAGFSRAWTQSGAEGVEWELGVGVPLILSERKPAWGALLQLKCEFEL